MMPRYHHSMDGDERADRGATDLENAAAVWLKTGYVPSLRGPGPGVFALGLAGFAGVLALLFPGPDAAFGAGLAAGAGTLAFALKSRPYRQESVLLVAMAVLIIVWISCLKSTPAFDGTLNRIAAVGAACVIVGLARFVALRRHALQSIAEASADWTVGDMVAYAEFLLDRRPCPGADDAARALYQRAAEMLLDKPWHERRDIKVIERFAGLLSERAPSAADMDVARIWRDHARALGAFAIDTDEPAPGAPRNVYEADDRNPRTGFDDFGFRRGIPVWRLKVANPDSLLDGEAVFRAFLLPEGALLACLVRFESVVDRTVLVHRVFDVSDPSVETYMAGSEHHLRWRIEMYDAKQVGSTDLVPAREPDAVREVDLKDSGLMAAFEQVLAHNAALGVHADIGSAYAFLTATFREYTASYGIEAAWSALEAACARVSD